MREVWKIKKKWYGGDIKRRMWLFDVLMWAVMAIGYRYYLQVSKTMDSRP